MTTQTPSIAVPAPGRGPGRRLGLGLAVGAVIAVAAGVGLWQANRGGGTTDTESPPTTAVARPSVAQSTEPVQTVYVVGSQAQADAMRAALAEADAIRASLGEAPLLDQVTVVSDAGADTFFRMMAEQDALRAQLGLPSLTVVDLRAPAASLPPLDAAPVSDAEMYQRWQQAQGAPVAAVDPRPPVGAAASAASPMPVYLVSTQADAAALRAGEPDAVVVVWDTAEADAILRAIFDFEPSNLRLVDRRFPPTATSGTQPTEESYVMPHITP
jgi:hypothetical protein